MHRTQKPDITFFYKGKYYALEIETPRDFHRKHLRLQAKAKANTKEYGVNWWFVATRSAYAKSFERYGSTITRNQINDWIKEHFSQTPA